MTGRAEPFTLTASGASKGPGMCGRYMITSPLEAIRDLFDLADGMPVASDALSPRYNVAPTQDVPIVRTRPDGVGRELALLRWGLIPHWAKDEGIGNRLINARGESVADKPSFRDSYRRRRCLVVADGFYEWKKEGTRKQPYYIRLKGGGAFGFAGLWSSWKRPDGGSVESCTIITTEPNALCAGIHDRMPVIVPPSRHADWLAPARTDGQALLEPYDSQAMEAWPVSPRVGNPRNDDPRLVEPLARQADLL